MHLTQKLLLICLSGMLLLVGAPTQAREHFSDLVFFGDSLSDPGNAFVLLGQVSTRPFDLIPSAPYARGGLHFSNGKTWAEDFAKALHQRSGPAFRNARAFSNYAVGSARARSAGATDLAAQVSLYLANRGSADPEALYVIFIGGNDIRDALLALQTDPSGISSAAILTGAITAIADNIGALAASGAQHFLVFNGPDLSLVPAVRLQGPLVQGAAQLLSLQFNQGLDLALANLSALFPSLDVDTLDLFMLFNEVVAQPDAFGFSNVETTCITPGVIIRAVCKHPNSYLFWDGIHPTRAGHRVLARRALSFFSESSEQREDKRAHRD